MHKTHFFHNGARVLVNCTENMSKRLDAFEMMKRALGENSSTGNAVRHDVNYKQTVCAVERGKPKRDAMRVHGLGIKWECHPMCCFGKWRDVRGSVFRFPSKEPNLSDS